ncbi:MAG: PrpF domain-containing protein, partial [Chitinophagaceae bacterium]|nr:PrpF domain-containing protein [Chitinophagaceae bacterium]
GMIPAGNKTTSAKVNIVNTGGICEVTVETPNGKVNYAGNAKVDGVPGTAAPVVCNYLETVGSTCGSLLPTGNAIDIINGTGVTCIDNGMPVVLMKAGDFNLKGDESKEVLEANELLKQKIEQIRLQAGVKMNLGDVNQQTIPKMCLISAPQQGGVLNTRMFIPHVVHDAIGVLAAVSVATACIVPGTVAEGVAQFEKRAKLFSIEHPTGEFTVNLDYELNDGKLNIIKSGVIRTARLLSRGEVFIPASFQEINSIYRAIGE